MTITSKWPGLYKEQHPVAPVTDKDPLASFERPRTKTDSTSKEKRQLRLGFACIWEPIRQQTWSGSAIGLRQELDTAAFAVDLGVQFPSSTRIALKALHTHYRGGRLTTSWSYSRLTEAYVTHSLERSLRGNRGDRQLDAVLMIDTIAKVREPFFVYYDSSWDALMSGAANLRQYADMRLLTASQVLRQRDRQLAIFERATGIITMSHWLAHSLVEQSGVPSDKVHVVPPGRVVQRADPSRFDGGASDYTDARKPQRLRSESGIRRRKLLFVGRLYKPFDFYRKGGDLVVDALRILRKEYDPHITLTMIGIDKWPLPGDPPEGIDVHDVLPRAEVAKLYETHDLFVMPSRMEPFGLVFTEALSHGMPCVARNAYAMPEVVTPGVSGALINRDDPNELAEAIVSVLSDDDLYKKCHERAPAMDQYFSWGRAARQIVETISQEVR